MKERSVPVSQIDIFSDESLVDCNRVHLELRALGEVVYLSKHNLYAATSYASVVALLQDGDVFCSSKGVGVSRVLNGLPDNKNTLLMSDGENHRRRREVFVEPLSPGALADLKEIIQSEAEALVGGLLKGGEFDVVQDFASYLPVSVVAELAGLPPDVRRKMVEWAPVTFDALGPLNRRLVRQLPAMGLDFLRAVNRLSEDSVAPGSWAEHIFQAVAQGRLSIEEGKALVVAYVIPSLDTTIFTAAHMFWLLAQHQDLFEEIREDTQLIPGVVNEVLRLASPVIGFTRYTTKETDLAGYEIEKGKRVVALLPSANRDERKYQNPDSFDVRRDPKDHVAFGYGRHRCAGVHLAKLELEELLRALCRGASRLTVGEAEFSVNSTLQVRSALPGRLE